MTDFAQARTAMVDCQVRPSDVTRYSIIDAMLETPREQFVPKALSEIAYSESEIPLAPGRVVLAPRTMAKMLEAASIGPDDLILDLAPGLGYSTALLSRLGAAVIAIEPDESMADHAAETLSRLEHDNALVSQGVAEEGDAAHGPFDVIFINGAVEEIPIALTQQLKDGGRIIAIVAEGAIGKCRIAVRAENSMAVRDVFDATAPVLDGFRKAKEFVF